MATAATRTFLLTSPVGGPLRGEVRSGGGIRPALVLWPGLPMATERLARAGFAVVALELPAAADDVDTLLAALRRGELGPTPPAIALLGHGAGGMEAAARVTGADGVAATVVWTAVPRAGVLEAERSEPTGARLTLVVPTPWAAGAAGFERALDESIRWLTTRLG